MIMSISSQRTSLYQANIAKIIQNKGTHFQNPQELSKPRIKPSHAYVHTENIKIPICEPEAPSAPKFRANQPRRNPRKPATSAKDVSVTPEASGTPEFLLDGGFCKGNSIGGLATRNHTGRGYPKDMGIPVRCIPLRFFPFSVSSEPLRGPRVW